MYARWEMAPARVAAMVEVRGHMRYTPLATASSSEVGQGRCAETRAVGAVRSRLREGTIVEVADQESPMISASPSSTLETASGAVRAMRRPTRSTERVRIWLILIHDRLGRPFAQDRKSTRLNSSH